jgi:HK97 gp10 family phage protein
MPLPRSVTKIKRDGVEFTSSVERAKYLLKELQRAALRDSGKFIRNRALREARKLPGLKRGKRPPNAFQYWVRKQETDLIVGIKHNTWYGSDQELGTRKQPKRAILTKTVRENVADIRSIMGQYLSTIEQENEAQRLIDENAEGGSENDG